MWTYLDLLNVAAGAQNDLQRATDIARSMITEYGMSDRLGLVTYERERRSMFPPDTFSAGKTYSEARTAQIDEEISKVIEEVHERVREILSQRRKVLDELAHLLLEKEVVQGEELRAMLSKSKPGIAASLLEAGILTEEVGRPAEFKNKPKPFENDRKGAAGFVA
jgi:cell division protease FtsH